MRSEGLSSVTYFEKVNIALNFTEFKYLLLE